MRGCALGCMTDVRMRICHPLLTAVESANAILHRFEARYQGVNMVFHDDLKYAESPRASDCG